MKIFTLFFTLTLNMLVVTQCLASFVSNKDVFGTRVFIENKGQFDKSINSTEKVLYAYENGGERIYFTAKGLVYKMTKTYPLSEHQREEIEHGKTIKIKPTKTYYINMNWVNANTNIQIEQSNKQSWYFTYGVAELNSYGYKKITYKNVYKNIDIEYTIPDDKDYGIKYNVILHPGANASNIKIIYSGDVNKLTKKGNDIFVKTQLIDIIEHAPVSYYENKQEVPSNFTLQHDTISFNFLQNYNTNQTLIIDPWVTTLTTLTIDNYGFDVDYDYAGNLYVYGGGGYSNWVSSDYQAAKYSPAGALIWTFAGSVGSINWTTGSWWAGNFLCEKTTGKTYIGNCPVNSGARIIRLDAAGLYDNFVSVQNNQWTEIWDLGYNCGTGEVYGFGGSTAITGSVSAGILNTITGAISPQNFSGLTTSCQDIVSHAFDPSGTLFLLFTSAFWSPSLDNKIMKVNATFNGNVWLQPSTYSSMSEGANKNSYVGITSSLNSNGFNCLAVNNDYLYYYDGSNLAAFNKTNGTKIASLIIPGLNLIEQGGIDVDDCNNVYIGGNGAILCYNFNGSNFSVNPPISLGIPNTNKYVYDLQLDRSKKLLYVSGSGFVGTYITSQVCSPLVLTYTCGSTTLQQLLPQLQQLF